MTDISAPRQMKVKFCARIWQVPRKESFYKPKEGYLSQAWGRECRRRIGFLEEVTPRLGLKR